jgi:hypothetical protein
LLTLLSLDYKCGLTCGAPNSGFAFPDQNLTVNMSYSGTTSKGNVIKES